MFSKVKYRYIIFKKTESGKIEAVGSFFRSELKKARIDFDMPEAKVMEEMAFKKKYPKIYERIFIDYWHIFVQTFLCSLDFIDYDNEIEYDEDNQVFRNEWFTLYQDIDREKYMIFDHHVMADQNKLRLLVSSLQQYFENIVTFHVNPACFPSHIEPNKVYYGYDAMKRLIAETAILTYVPN